MIEKPMEKAYRKECLRVAQKMSGIITLDDSERQPCEIWTRVMGYHRPVSEFYSRKYFTERKTVAKALPSPVITLDDEQTPGPRLPYKD